MTKEITTAKKFTDWMNDGFIEEKSMGQTAEFGGLQMTKWLRCASGPTETVYAYMPKEVIQRVVDLHGGVVGYKE